MTIFELADQLPNGFHDAEITHLAIDYTERTVDIEMGIWIGNMDSPPNERETYRAAIIRLSGVEHFAIDPPDPASHYDTSDCLTIDVHKEDIPFLQPKNAKAFRFRMFVSQYNGFIHCCALSVEMTWQGNAYCR